MSCLVKYFFECVRSFIGKNLVANFSRLCRYNTWEPASNILNENLFTESGFTVPSGFKGKVKKGATKPRRRKRKARVSPDESEQSEDDNQSYSEGASDGVAEYGLFFLDIRHAEFFNASFKKNVLGYWMGRIRQCDENFGLHETVRNFRFKHFGRIFS